MKSSNVIPLNRYRVPINQLIKFIVSNPDAFLSLFFKFIGADKGGMAINLSKEIGVPVSVAELIMFGFTNYDNTIIEINNHIFWDNEEVIKALEWVRDNPENNQNPLVVSQVFNGFFTVEEMTLQGV